MSKLKKMLKGSKYSKLDLMQKLASDAEENDIALRRKKEVLDECSLVAAREELRKEKLAKRKMKSSARWKNIEIEKSKGPRAKRKFMYKAGDLVTIKRTQRWHNVVEGDIGIICDQDDTGKDYLLRYEEQRILWVMGPRNLERWDASWVEWADDCDEEPYGDLLDTPIVETPVAENFEILGDETIIPLEDNVLEATEIIEGSMIIWQDSDILHLVQADTAEYIGNAEPDVPLIVVSMQKNHSGTIDIVALYGSDHIRAHIKPGSKYEIL